MWLQRSLKLPFSAARSLPSQAAAALLFTTPRSRSSHCPPSPLRSCVRLSLMRLQIRRHILLPPQQAQACSVGCRRCQVAACLHQVRLASPLCSTAITYLPPSPSAPLSFSPRVLDIQKGQYCALERLCTVARLLRLTAAQAQAASSSAHCTRT